MCPFGSAGLRWQDFRNQKMATTTQIGNVGERLVAAWLAARNYSTNIDTKGDGSTDIEARSTQASLLVQVKAAVQPNTPASLTPEEELNIKSRATRLRLQAWEAKVQLNQQFQQVGDIQWRKLA